MKKKFILAFAAVFSALTIVAAGGNTGTAARAASTKTGTGLANHVSMAYSQGWKYRYGTYGQMSGKTRTTDCSGLIKSYMWWQGEGKNPKAGSVSISSSSSDMINTAKVKGTINYGNSSSLPRVHGLLLHQPGHVGVYIGNNVAIDNRSASQNMVKESVFGKRNNKWVSWGKIKEITYPTTGWETFNGNKYYYENGQYVVGATKTLDGVSYTFGSDGTIANQVSAQSEIKPEPVPAAAATETAPAATGPVPITTPDAPASGDVSPTAE